MGDHEDLRLTGMDAWLSTVPGLDPDAARRAGGLFGRHGFDDSLLDFLASEGGLQILTAWRDHQQVEPVETGPAQGLVKTGAQQAIEATQDEDKQTKRPLGRQKITAADRRLDCHRGFYFSGADSTQSNSGNGRKRVSGNTPPAQKSSMPAAPKALATVTEVAAAEATAEQANAHPEKTDPERVTGVLKSFSCETNYGFVRCHGIVQDVFLRGCDIPSDRQSEPGRQLSCVIVKDSRGRPQARQVRWEEPAQSTSMVGCVGIVESESHRFQGRIKSMGSDYGFIDCPEASRMYGRDVYFYMVQLPPGSLVGQLVSFDLLLQPQAKRISWVAEDSDSDMDIPVAVCSGDASVGGKRW